MREPQCWADKRRVLSRLGAIFPREARHLVVGFTGYTGFKGFEYNKKYNSEQRNNGRFVEPAVKHVATLVLVIRKAFYEFAAV
jgi:hypothetical protein